MGMALILNQRMRLRNIFRGWLLLPWVTPAFVTALTARWMFDFTTGVINFVLVKLHVIRAPITWLANPATALFAVTATSIWRGFPFYGVTFLAAMQAVPVELYEAAEVDGATAWDKFWYVTIPGIRTVVLIVVMLSTIWTMNDFATVFIMTGGGPGYATHTIPTYAYQLGFMTSRFGYAVAVSMTSVPLFIVLILALSPLIMRGEGE
jgi:multiple sugar transport system permease protein/arabinogalactan oligomer/maltooligosaccharide transport system permease protein